MKTNNFAPGKIVMWRVLIVIVMVATTLAQGATVERIFSCFGDQLLYSRYLVYLAQLDSGSIDTSVATMNARSVIGSKQYFFDSADVAGTLAIGTAPFDTINHGHDSMIIKVSQKFSQIKQDGFDAVEIVYNMPSFCYTNTISPNNSRQFLWGVRRNGEAGEVWLAALKRYNDASVPSSRLKLRVRITVNIPAMSFAIGYPNLDAPRFNYLIGDVLNIYPSLQYYPSGAFDTTKPYPHEKYAFRYYSRYPSAVVHSDTAHFSESNPDIGNDTMLTWMAGWAGYLTKRIKAQNPATTFEAVTTVWDPDGQSMLSAARLPDSVALTPWDTSISSFTGAVVQTPISDVGSEIQFLNKRDQVYYRGVNKIVDVIKKAAPGIQVGIFYQVGNLDDRLFGTLDMYAFMYNARVDFIVSPEFGDTGIDKSRSHVFRLGSIARRAGKKWVIESSWPTILRENPVNFLIENSDFDSGDSAFYANWVQAAAEYGVSATSVVWFPMRLFDTKPPRLSNWKRIWGASATSYLKDSVSAFASTTKLAVYMGNVCMDDFQRRLPGMYGYIANHRWLAMARAYSRTPNVEFLTDGMLTVSPGILSTFQKIVLPPECPLRLADPKIQKDYRANRGRYILPEFGEIE
jgi:hypothetical protein